MIIIQLYAAHWQDLNDVNKHGVVCYGWAPLGKQPKTHYQHFDRTHDQSFDAWMWAIKQMLIEILAEKALQFEPVQIEFVVHKQRTKNEYSSMVSLMKTLQRLTKCQVDDITIETGKRLVVKGKKMTRAMYIKQELIAVMLKCVMKERNICFRYRAVDVKSSDDIVARFLTCYQKAQTKAELSQSNVVVFPGVTD